MTWDNILNELDAKLKLLIESDLIKRSEINEKINFKKGIYVFYEDSQPIYVGRTNRLKIRLKEHGDLKGSHFSASFAFLLAKHKAKEKNFSLKNPNGKTKTRAELENDTEFNFLNQKERVAKMQFRVIEITDANFQAIFEIYASMKLETLHNKFDNH